MSLRPKGAAAAGKRQHHATRHHKGQHMGDAAHQVAVFAAQLLPVAGAEGVPRGRREPCRKRPFPAAGPRRAASPPRHRPAACPQTAPVDRAVYRHDHALCSLDLIIGQFVVDTGSAVRLDLERQAAGLRGLLERLGRQVGVRNAGGESRHGQQLIAGLGARPALRQTGQTAAPVRPAPRGDGAAECLGSPLRRRAQKSVSRRASPARPAPVRAGRWPRRGGDHHQQVQRLAVRCVAGQRRVQRQRSQLQLPDGGAFGVGDRQSIAHADAAQFQPGADICRKHSGVSQIVSPSSSVTICCTAPVSESARWRSATQSGRR